MPIYHPYNRFYAPVVFDGTATFDGETFMNDRLSITQVPSGAREALKLTGANALANILFVEDVFTNPLYVVPTDGGDAMLGDRRRAFRPGDVFNVDWQVLTAVADNVAANAGGIQLGHLAGATLMYAGNGAPGAAHPVTTGVPANGSLYFRNDGGVGTTLYQVQAGVWAPIL